MLKAPQVVRPSCLVRVRLGMSMSQRSPTRRLETRTRSPPMGSALLALCAMPEEEAENEGGGEALEPRVLCSRSSCLAAKHLHLVGNRRSHTTQEVLEYDMRMEAKFMTKTRTKEAAGHFIRSRTKILIPFPKGFRDAFR